MGRPLLHDLTGDDFIGSRVYRLPSFIVVGAVVLRQRLGLCMLGIAIVNTVAYLRVILEKSAHTFHLVIGQRVHRINDDCTDTGGKSSGFLLSQ